MVGISDIPADVHKGVWHIELRSTKATEFFGGAQFKYGRTVLPVPGRVVRHVVSVLSKRVVRCWRASGGNECVFGEPFEAAETPDDTTDSDAPGEGTPEADAVELADMDKPALVALAESEGVEVDKRWGRERLLATLVEHFDAPGDGTETDAGGSADTPTGENEPETPNDTSGDTTPQE